VVAPHLVAVLVGSPVATTLERFPLDAILRAPRQLVGWRWKQVQCHNHIGVSSVPPVRIELDDFGTSHRLTELRRGERWLSGRYLSFDVWQQLFDFSDGTWLAAIYGGFHDSFVAISVDPQLLGVLPTHTFELPAEAAEMGNVSRRVANAGFRALDEELLAYFGFGGYDEVRAVPERAIRRHIHLHDDFIFFLDPLDELLLREALHLVVGVHEHYLDVSLSEVENDRIAALIETELLAQRRIELRSTPVRRTITITYRVPAGQWWRRLLRLTDKASTDIVVAP
jgi:hypothetical protein